MKVKEFLAVREHNVITVDSNATIYRVIHMLVENKIGALPVCDKNGIMEGIITERDLLKVCTQSGERISRIKVKNVMTKDVLIGLPEDDIDYVMNVMTQQRIRHLPIMDGLELVGMISARDIVESQLKQSKAEIRHLSDYLELLKVILQDTSHTDS